MKLLLMVFVLVNVNVFAAWDWGKGLNECGEKIYTKQILERVDDFVFDVIDRHPTTYTPGIVVWDYSDLVMCQYSSNDQTTMVAGTKVIADLWSDEGELGRKSSECFIKLERWDGEWLPRYVQCEDFSIDEEVE